MINNICIIGSGNIAHALIAFVGANSKKKINVLSNSLSDKLVHIKGRLDGKLEIVGNINKISSKPKDVIPGSDLILLTVPAFIRKSVLMKIRPYITKDMFVGAFPGIGGFSEEIESTLQVEGLTYFSSQRVPCIARIIEKGESVSFFWKDEISIATNVNKGLFKLELEEILKQKVIFLDSFLEVNLSNSNPILHSARLYSLLNKSKTGFFKDEVLFYEEWTDDSSEILLKMDEEFMLLVNTFRLKNVKSLKEHYGVESAKEMTKKIRSIKAFRGIVAPMVKMDLGYRLDTNSRYFTEDIAVGLNYIKSKSDEVQLAFPMINKVCLKLNEFINTGSTTIKNVDG